MHSFLVASGIALFLMMVPMLYRIIVGPTAIDRVVAVNVIGTKTAVLLVVIGVVVVLVGMTGTDLQDDMGWGRLVYLIMLLVFIGAGLGGTFARNPGKSLRHAGIWVAIAAGLALLLPPVRSPFQVRPMQRLKSNSNRS